MAKLKSFMLKQHQENKPTYTIEVPTGSIFLKCLAVPEGIIVIYEIHNPEASLITEVFKILQQDEEIPKNSYCAEILTLVVENEDKEQVTIILPVYKLL